MSSRVFVGDVFAVPLDGESVGFFQYIARDLTQLNSHVVRVFKERRRTDDLGDVDGIVRGEVHFHAHVFLSVGIKLHFWSKMSRAGVMEGQRVLFRDSTDYGRSKEKLSNNWFVWEVGGPHSAVGPLRGPNRDAEIGIVVPP
jgi:hypothetical protein